MTGDTRRALVIADHLFSDELADLASAPLIGAGWDVTRTIWAIGSIEDQRRAVRQLENDGPDAAPGVPELAQPHDYDVVVTQFCPVSAADVAGGSRLSLIAVNRAGMQNVAVDAARAAGVEVFNVPGRNSNAVAEHTIALMLAQLRFVAMTHAALKRGQWTEEFPNPGPRELAEVTVGVVGYGQIGRRVHELLRAFGPRVVVHDPFLDGPVDGADAMALADLMAASDVVTLHVPLADSTRHMIGRAELERLGPLGVLVNTARAELVDQTAMRAALHEGVIGGAALDVFDREPLDADDLLVTSERTTLTPHLAGTTRQAFVQGPQWIADRLRALVAE